jgi:glycosyltransferase involved in cell wall biosynthesis
LNILFVHGAWPNQFTALHRHLRTSGLARSWFLTNERDRSFWQYRDGFPEGVLSYTPDGEPGQQSYYYSGTAERNARHALPILRACEVLVPAHDIDVVVAHGILGAPHMLFDEIDVPIVSYVEFPSFRLHQWDPQYPPHDAQRLCDKYEEMLNFQAALRSDLVITPSQYAKRMFPARLQDNVTVQMEGFDPGTVSTGQAEPAFRKEPGCVYVGFAASTLSSEKGLEHFIAVSKRLSQLNPQVRYVLIGAESGPSYGYEGLFLEHLEPRPTFKEFLFGQHSVDPSLYVSTGRLDGAAFSSTIDAIDFFLYPLQFGSANWGLFELLLRGKVVVASDRCFLPEVITSGENGLLLPYEEIEPWVQLADRIARAPAEFRAIGERAAHSMRRFHIDAIAPQYLAVFEQAIRRHRAARGS